MDTNLPLLPEKEGAVCVDVRPVLREVFRDLEHLPPLDSVPFENKDDDDFNDDNASVTRTDKWIRNISSEYKNLYQQEIKLQKQHVKRLARETLPNIYQLHSPAPSSEHLKEEVGLLRRQDLKPSLRQNANCKESLWVKNILNRSSGDVSVVNRADSPVNRNVPLQQYDDTTLQSISMGEILPKPPPPAPFVPAPLPPPDNIICIPSTLDFMNFQVGLLHTQSLRFVNVSKFEVRISIRPPSRRELDVELCSRLVVTSGSAAEVKVHFRPRDVRAFSDQLEVRVSSGQALSIPIACYMEPPLLEILVPNKAISSSHTMESNNDVIDLGSKLLGDVHRTEFVLRCGATNAAFFLLAEDSWIDSTVVFTEHRSGKAKKYGISVDSFFISPVRWSGGRDVTGVAVCRAAALGLQAAALRVISSTAITRPLNFIADTVLFSPKHFTIEAHEKDYDICSEGDPLCDYYVNLGVAFPHRSLSETINIVNHSPLYYNYYWKTRPWGYRPSSKSSKESVDIDESDDNLQIRLDEVNLTSEKDAEMRCSINESLDIVAEEAFGCMRPHSTVQTVVHAPDAGEKLGVQRSVLMLVVTDVPKASISMEHESLIMSVKDREEDDVPEMFPTSEEWSRQTCEVLCAQVEVWWEVVPVRFVLDPPVIRLPHSHRVKKIATQIRATQLYGVSNVKANWEVTEADWEPRPPSPLTLAAARPTLTDLALPLLPDRCLRTDVIRLVSEGGEWSASTVVEQCCDTRHLSVEPSFSWLGVVPPAATVAAALTVRNDTYQDVHWSATCCRWWGDRDVSAACRARPPCAACRSRACTCAMLAPTRGTLKHSQQATILYKVCAPDSDGCVATLVQVRSTDSSGGRSVEARSALLAYRVLAPHLVLRVFPCYGDKRRGCKGCSLDTPDAERGSPVLRPGAALPAGARACCRLRVTNITPLSTRVLWEPPLENEDVLQVTFIPNEFEVKGHSEVDVTVVLEAKKVCDRRLFVRKANVAHSQKPLYLVIDAAVSGVEVIVELPTGDKETSSFAAIKLLQNEDVKEDVFTTSAIDAIFSNYDLKRKRQQENICYCDYEMVYIPPKKKIASPTDLDEEHHIEIRAVLYLRPCPPVEAPPALARVCPCAGRRRPDLPGDPEACCLQFQRVGLRTVTTRTVVLRNVSQIDARWRASVRRWPRIHTRTIDKEHWAGDGRAPGAVLRCRPAGGVLRAGEGAPVEVSVCADSWGVYRDQISLQVEHLAPLVLDVWVEGVGPPLECALRPAGGGTRPTLWTSHTDPVRAVQVKNTSRSDLMVHAYVVRENVYPQDELPFRLYMRLFDVPKGVCLCVTSNSSAVDSTSTVGSEPSVEVMGTGVELYLAADHGVQDDTYYQVQPPQRVISAGDRATYKVSLQPRHEVAPHTQLMLRSTPVENIGDNWYRPDPPLQLVQLRQAQRTPRLQVSCDELRVKLCALDLPYNDIIRARKRFNLKNVGDGPLELLAVTETPWSVDVAHRVCEARCVPEQTTKLDKVNIYLPARSSTEMVVEVSVETSEAWPATGDTYLPRTVSSAALCFLDPDDVNLMVFNQNGFQNTITGIKLNGLSQNKNENLKGLLHLSLPLILEMDYPVVTLEPDAIDFGDVKDGNTRKSYVTVHHSSPTATLDLVVTWTGDEEFRLWPPSLKLQPGTSGRVYIEYTSRWLSAAAAGGAVCARARGAAGRWCGACVPVRARARLCAARSAAHVDFTDDTNLVPRVL